MNPLKRLAAFLKLLFRCFLLDRRAMAKMGGSIVTILISLMVTILIGVVVVQALITSQTQTGWSATANTTWTSLQTNVWTAFTLLVIIPIIVGAVAILGYLRFGGG